MDIVERIDNCLNEAKYTDELGEFFVVTKPTKNSELIDIFFKADIKSIIMQGKGGLTPDEIVGVYKNEKKARKVALNLLKQ